MYKRVLEFLLIALLCSFAIVCVSCAPEHQLEEVSAVAATCEEPGNIAHWHCSDCGENFLDEEGKNPVESIVIPPLEHNYSDAVIVRSTCTEPGEEVKICQRCGKESRTELPPGEHLFHTYETVAPTCSEPGERVSICVNCNVQEKEVIPATNAHELKRIEGVPASCESAGIIAHWRCGECQSCFFDEGAIILLENVVITPLGHDLSPAQRFCVNCEEGGETLRFCSRCEYEERKEIPPQSHSFLIETTSPTCTKEGERVEYCENCEVKTVSVLPATGIHIFDYENVCTMCKLKCLATADLKYSLISEKGLAVGYRVESCGAAGEIVVPYYHEKLPILEIGADVFADQTNLLSFVCYAPLRAIGDRAFKGCTKLSSIQFPETLLSIGEEAFRSCTSLRSVELPESLKLLSKRAFYACSKVQSLKIGKNLESIGDNAFWNMEKLSQIEVDEQNAIYSGAGNCLIVKETATLILGSSKSEIPEQVKIIGSSAFLGRTDLKKIVIPASVVEIQDFAFRDCVKLKQIVFAGTQEQWDAVKKGNEWNKYTDDALQVSFLK